MVNVPGATSWRALILIALLLAFAPNIATATVIPYQMNLDGIQEAPSSDLDGTANGTISFDTVTGLVSWDLIYANIDTPIAMHIHGPGGLPGINAGVFTQLGVNTSGGANTLIDSVGVNVADVASIVGDPGGFYINIHTVEFPGGSVRGQLGNVVPLPSTLALLGLGLAGFGFSTRRKV